MSQVRIKISSANSQKWQHIQNNVYGKGHRLIECKFSYPILPLSTKIILYDIFLVYIFCFQKFLSYPLCTYYV